MKQLHNRMDWQTAWQQVGEVATKHTAIAVAMRALGISRAHLYRLVRRWFQWQGQEPSQAWLCSPRRTRRSSLPEPTQKFLREELRYLTQESQHFRNHVNFSVLAQRCHQRFHKRVSRHRIRHWAIEEGLFKPEIHSTAKALRRFDVGKVGELFQHDSSPHLWVPHSARRDNLILTIDDHSRKIVGALLVPRDTAFHHLTVLRTTLETYARPLAYYTDNAQIFKSDSDVYGQFSRALRDLQIDPRLTAKGHPEAKGKVEKRFDYLQRRIPYLCERYRIKSLTAANRILRQEVDYFNDCHVHAETKQTPNQRWKKALQEGRSSIRPLTTPMHELDLIFGIHYRRKIRKDGHFTFQGQLLHVPTAPRYGEVELIIHPPFGRRNFTQLTVLHKQTTLRLFIKPAGQLAFRPL